eukprot:SAG31_NODE_4502_length_3183_cov_1.674125_3_plen_116_part_00
MACRAALCAWPPKVGWICGRGLPRLIEADLPAPTVASLAERQPVPVLALVVVVGMPSHVQAGRQHGASGAVMVGVMAAVREAEVVVAVGIEDRARTQHATTVTAVAAQPSLTLRS